jgi:hypothetical protein
LNIAPRTVHRIADRIGKKRTRRSAGERSYRDVLRDLITADRRSHDHDQREHAQSPDGCKSLRHI